MTSPNFLKIEKLMTAIFINRQVGSPRIASQLKGEIFKRSDFYDFYTIKSIWAGDFGLKYKINILIFGRARPHLSYFAHTSISS